MNYKMLIKQRPRESISHPGWISDQCLISRPNEIDSVELLLRHRKKQLSRTAVHFIEGVCFLEELPAVLAHFFPKR